MRSEAVYSPVYPRSSYLLRVTQGVSKSLSSNCGVCRLGSIAEVTGTGRARLASARGMHVQAQPVHPFPLLELRLRARPLNRAWGRSSISAPAACTSRAACRAPCGIAATPPPQPHHFATQCLSKAVGRLLEAQLFVCDVFKDQISIHKPRSHHFV